MGPEFIKSEDIRGFQIAQGLIASLAQHMENDDE